MIVRTLIRPTGAGASAPGRVREVRTREVARLRDAVAGPATPHDITVRSAGGVDGHVAAATLVDTNVVFVRYGGDVVVEAGATGDRVVVTLPLGPMGVGFRAVRDARSSSFVLAPDRRTLMVPDPWAGALIVAADIARVREHLERLLGTPVHGELEFLADHACVTPLPRSHLDSTCRAVRDSLLASGGDLAPVAARVLEQAVLSAVLLSLPHNYTDRLCGTPDRVSTSHAEAVREWMEVNFADAVTVPDVAAAVGLSVRQLQSVVLERYGVTPTELLREIRLTRARDHLADAVGAPPATVAQAAHRCGFTHLGRFSALYRVRFGEAPSASLHRAQTSSVQRRNVEDGGSTNRSR